MLRPWIVCAVVFAAGCATAPQRVERYDDPTIAYPFTRATMARTDVASCMSRILERAGQGHMPFEAAAFLVLRDDGRFQCEIWPATFDRHKIRWTGRAPVGTAAILHTHPIELPEPSAHDVREAHRLGVPMFVVTTAQIAMVSSNGEVVRQPTAVIASAGHRRGR